MAYSVPTNPDVPYTASLDGKFVRSYVSRRTANALSRSNVRTITQLCALPRSTLQAMPGLGDIAMRELDVLLSSLGLTLAEEKPEPRARRRVRPCGSICGPPRIRRAVEGVTLMYAPWSGRKPS